MTRARLLDLPALLSALDPLRAQGKRVVLCHGHFNAIHPGHLRFLQYAREQGDLLVVAVMQESELPASARSSYFPQSMRAEAVASVDLVDFVFALDRPVAAFIEALRPAVYVKGKEFEEQKGFIRDQLEAVERGGGRVVFGSGDVHYAATELHDARTKPRERLATFLSVCRRSGIDPRRLGEVVKQYEKVKLLVVGDTIVDQFVSCDVLGVSAEAPVLTIRELSAHEFVGGAAIVACHIQALGATCTYVSVIGNDASGDFLQRELGGAGIAHLLLRDDTRPTTYKIRYLVDNQKVLRVSRLRQHNLSESLESMLIDRIAKRIRGVDAVIVSDFVYGVVTPRVLEAITAMAHEHGVMLFGDVQCSSQVGDAGRFRAPMLVTPTEKEARIALGDFSSGVEIIAAKFLARTQAKHLVLKLGAQGLVAYTPRPGADDALQPLYFPALEPNPVDVAGAGDALLSAMAVSMCAGADLVTAAAIGTCAAAISVGRVGNLPISGGELSSYLANLEQEASIL